MPHPRSIASLALLSSALLTPALVVAFPLGAATAQDAAKSAASTDAPRSGSIDPERLAALVKRAEASKSSALVVLQDGKLVGEWYFDQPKRPIEAMSATKSVVSLAIGKLIDTGKIQSLDQPVADFYPEWRQGRKQKITVGQLLNHTSGLQNPPRTDEIYMSPDFVQLALAAELADDPGSSFSYNNKAVNLLAGVVQKASGKRMDEYIRDEIFAPLGIVDFTWTLDDAGNPHAMAGLQIHARDFAKIGQMLVDGGVWEGKRVLSKEWVELSTAKPAQALDGTCGLLWWLLSSEERIALADDGLLAKWRAVGCDAAFLEKMATLKDRVYPSREAAVAALTELFGGKEGLALWQANAMRAGAQQWRNLPTPVEGYAALGFLGQYLVVVPEQRIVAVRQLEPDWANFDETKTDSMNDFTDLVLGLAKSDR